MVVALPIGVADAGRECRHGKRQSEIGPLTPRFRNTATLPYGTVNSFQSLSTSASFNFKAKFTLVAALPFDSQNATYPTEKRNHETRRPHRLDPGDQTYSHGQDH